MVIVLASIVAAALLHLLGIAVTARLFGVNIVEIGFGFGPKLFNTGKVSVKSLPLGGYVKLLDSRADSIEEHDNKYAFDLKPTWVRVLITLSGCVFVLLVASLFLGKDVIQVFTNSFSTIFSGAASPTGSAQVYIDSAKAYILSNPANLVFSVTAVYFAAFNLFPLPMLNGGRALLELLGRSDKIIGPMNIIGLIAWVLIFLSWLSALVINLWF